MSAVSLILDNYIMLAVLPGLWVLLESNVHLKKKTIRITRWVMILIFAEAVLWSIERWYREVDYLSYVRIFFTPTIYLLHPLIMLGIIEMAECVGKNRVILLARSVYRQWSPHCHEPCHGRGCRASRKYLDAHHLASA